MPPEFVIRLQVNHRRGDDFRPLLTIYKGDVGVRLEVLVLDGDGMPLDLSGADDAPVIAFTKPDGTTLTRTAGFVNDGTDGLVAYRFAAGDLDVVGTWRFTLTTGSRTWEPQAFAVWQPLPLPLDNPC